MNDGIRRNTRIGELIVAAFDRAGRFNHDPRVVSRIATDDVTRLLLDARREPGERAPRKHRSTLNLRHAIATGILIASAFASKTAVAQPSFFYVDGAWALPVHAAWSTFVEGGQRVAQGEVLRSDFGLPSLSGGIGLGYAGLNGQIDFRNSLNVTTGAATVGFRAPLTIGIFELWLRAGIGPALIFDAHDPVKIQVAGGIATDLEAGADVFVLPFLALGLKLVGAPQYSWPANFAFDLGLNLGVRLAF